MDLTEKNAKKSGISANSNFSRFGGKICLHNSPLPEVRRALSRKMSRVASLSSLHKHGGLSDQSELRFGYLQEAHLASLQVIKKGNGGNVVIKIIDQETGEEFDKEREWMDTCVQRTSMKRKGPNAKSKARFNPLDKIHVFEQGKDMGSLRHVYATCEQQKESAEMTSESSTSEDEEQSNRGEKSRARQSAISRKETDISCAEEEGSWESLECLMNAFSEEEVSEEVEDSDAQEEQNSINAVRPWNQLNAAEIKGRFCLLNSLPSWMDASKPSVLMPFFFDVLVYGKPLLGVGAFAVVKRAQWMGVPVALKSINKLKKNLYNKHNLQRELEVWW